MLSPDSLRKYMYAVSVILSFSFHHLSYASTNELGDDLADSIPEVQPVDFDSESLLSDQISTNRWDAWHKRWSVSVMGAANYVDQFFGDDVLVRDSNETRVRLTLGARIQDREDMDFIHRVNVRLALPNLSKRAQLVVEDMFGEDDSDSLGQLSQDPNQSSANAAIRYNVEDRKNLRLDADIGARFSSPSQLYLRLRAIRTFEISRKLELRLIETVKWYTSDGFLGQSEVQWNRRMGWDWLFRSSSQLEWRESADGVRPSQVFSLFKTLSRHRALRFEIGGSWPETPHTQEAVYTTSLAFRRRIHSNWVFSEVRPGVDFKQEYDFDPQPFIVLQFEWLFGNLEK